MMWAGPSVTDWVYVGVVADWLYVGLVADWVYVGVVAHSVGAAQLGPWQHPGS